MLGLIGKNGSGKTYIANKLAKLGYKRSVNYTSRPMRKGEIDGQDYVFVSKSQFEKFIEDGYFIEFKLRNGDYYGTPKKNITPEALIISGNYEKFSKEAGTEIMPIFINCSLNKRYERVKRRNTSAQEMFSRFHGENFLYLNDFKGLFVDNEKENSNSIDTILSATNSSGEVIDYSYINNNYNFLNNQIKKFEQTDSDDDLKKFLEQEEFVMRKISQIFDLSSSIQMLEAQKYYLAEMQKYLTKNKIQFSKDDNEILMEIESNPFLVDFKRDKIEKSFKEKI